jgi:hypothetical protein
MVGLRLQVNVLSQASNTKVLTSTLTLQTNLLCTMLIIAMDMVWCVTGRRFDFATVTSTLSLEMIPEASRVPFVAAIIGYLTEEVNLSVNVSSIVSGSGLGFRLSLASSLSGSLRSSFATPASLVPTYTVTFGDKTSKNIDGPVEAIAAVEYTHCYRSTGAYNVTVQAVSAFGTGAIWEQRVSATDACGSASSLRAPLACVVEWLQLA